MGKCPPGCLFWCAYVILQAPRAGPYHTHREHAEGLFECCLRRKQGVELAGKVDCNVATMLTGRS